MDSFMESLFQATSQDLSAPWSTMQAFKDHEEASTSLPPQPHMVMPFGVHSQHAIYVGDNTQPSMLSPMQMPMMPPTTMQSPSPVDEHGQPVKVRKKPGRKPNPASPALRKAQNRAAQRAFRERKERHLRDLENTIKSLRDQRNNAVKELNATKSKLDAFKAENWYLKGVVLTLQFVCMHHNIHIPTHSPYLAEEALSEMAKTSPHAIEAYVNAYTRNNVNLKSTMASHFANVSSEERADENESTHDEKNTLNYPDGDSSGYHDQDGTGRASSVLNSVTSPTSDGWSYQDNDMTDMELCGNRERSAESMVHVKHEMQDDLDVSQWLHIDEERDRHQRAEQQQMQQQQQQQQSRVQPDSLNAIQRIRLQLRVQSALTSFGKVAVRLQPTLLQLAIPHDPRIDLIPTPHMRDRMIIFRDQINYDECFTMLLNGAVYHGGDPTMSDNWELPAEFFSEYWFLATAYDVRKTNKWRRLKGLPEIKAGPANEEQLQLANQTVPMDASQQVESPAWSDDVLAQFSEGMPTLQPFEISNGLSETTSYPASPSTDSEKEAHPLYKQFLRSPPGKNRPFRSASFGAMMDLMEALTTESQS